MIAETKYITTTPENPSSVIKGISTILSGGVVILNGMEPPPGKTEGYYTDVLTPNGPGLFELKWVDCPGRNYCKAAAKEYKRLNRKSSPDTIESLLWTEEELAQKEREEKRKKEEKQTISAPTDTLVFATNDQNQIQNEVITLRPKKTKKSIKRYVSGKAYSHLQEQLTKNPPTFRHETEVFVFLLDLLYRLPTYNKDLVEKDNGYIAISSEYFKAFISNEYRNCINYLIEIALYQCDGKYDNEKHISLGYRLNEKYESDCICVEIKPGSLIWKKITENFNNKNHKKLSDLEKEMKAHLKQIDFDIEGAKVYLKEQRDNGFINQTQYNIHCLAVETIFDKKFYLKRNRTNYRVDSNLTNMKKELRQFMNGYSQIDLVNSQPYLLNLLLAYSTNNSISTKYINSIPTHTSIPTHLSSCGVIDHTKVLQGNMDRLFRELRNPPVLNSIEVQKYRKLTQTGKIYEHFMTKFGKNRKEAKTLFIGALYAPNCSSNFRQEQQLFKEEFPTISKLLWQLKTKTKRKDYANLSIALQTLESEIFINNIAARLYSNNIPVYTVHDSVIVKDENVTEVMAVLQEVFIKYFGEVPEFKVEKLSPDNIKPFEEVKAIIGSSCQFDTDDLANDGITSQKAINDLLAYAEHYAAAEETENSGYHPTVLTPQELEKYQEFCQQFDEEFMEIFVLNSEKLEEAA